MATLTKVCKVCGVSKPLDDFHRDKRQVFGRKSQCRSCVAAGDNVKRKKYGAKRAPATPYHKRFWPKMTKLTPEQRALVADYEAARVPPHTPAWPLIAHMFRSLVERLGTVRTENALYTWSPSSRDVYRQVEREIFRSSASEHAEPDRTTYRIDLPGFR